VPRDGVNCCSRKRPSRVTANKTIYEIYLPSTYSIEFPIASEHDKAPSFISRQNEIKKQRVRREKRERERKKDSIEGKRDTGFRATFRTALFVLFVNAKTIAEENYIAWFAGFSPFYLSRLCFRKVCHESLSDPVQSEVRNLMDHRSIYSCG